MYYWYQHFRIVRLWTCNYCHCYAADREYSECCKSFYTTKTYQPVAIKKIYLTTKRLYVHSYRKCQFNCKTIGIGCEWYGSRESTYKTNVMCHNNFSYILYANDLKHIELGSICASPQRYMQQWRLYETERKGWETIKNKLTCN